jgi:hypothetical protein
MLGLYKLSLPTFALRYPSIVRGEFLIYVKDFKIINERIHYLRLKAK